MSDGPLPLSKFLKGICQVDIYYIFPFVFDFQSYTSGASVLKLWKTGELSILISNFLERELKPGLPKSRRGFPPILPYKALETRFGYFEKNGSEVTLKKCGGNKEEKVKLDKTFIIRECGNGALTYKFSKEIKKASDTETGVSLKDLLYTLEAFFHLIPRYPFAYKKGKDEGYHYDNNELWVEVRETLRELEKKVRQKFEKQIGDDKIWEDREVFYVGGTHEDEPVYGWPKPVVQPYAFIVLKVERKMYEQFSQEFKELYEVFQQGKYPSIFDNNSGTREERVKELEKFTHFFQALIYRYWNVKRRREANMNLGELFETATNVEAFDWLRLFTHHTSSLTLVQIDKKDEEKFKKLLEWYLPNIITNIEFCVCRVHFALVLDALLDELLHEVALLPDLNSSASIVKLKELRRDFYRLQLQTALFLEDISQHVTTGPFGLTLSSKLNEVFHAQRIEERMRKKLDMTERVLLGKQLDIDDAICGLNRPARP